MKHIFLLCLVTIFDIVDIFYYNFWSFDLQINVSVEQSGGSSEIAGPYNPSTDLDHWINEKQQSILT